MATGRTLGHADKDREPVESVPAGLPVGAGVSGPVGHAPVQEGGTARGLGDLEAGAEGRGITNKGPHITVDPTTEDRYWRHHFHERPYVHADRGYDHYQPAYRMGWEAHEKHAGRDWKEVQPLLEEEWKNNPVTATSQIAWNDAKLAAEDAWNRLVERRPGLEPRMPR